MVKSFTKALFAAAVAVACGFNASAVDYISVTPVANPANGYNGGPQGYVNISWPGVQLQMDSRDKDVKTPVDPSYVTIKVNTNTVPIDPNSLGGGKVLVGAQEVEGGGNVDDVLSIQFPDMFFWWEGNVTVTVKEGAVTSTTGAVNPELTLNYVFTSLNYDAIWEPAQSDDGSNVALVAGEAVAYVSWEGCSDLSITGTANPFYQKATTDNNGSQVPATQYMSIANGKVKFDLTSFETGSYILVLPDGAIDLGNGTKNGEAVYNFKIVETMVPECYVSPVPSEYGYFDGFKVVWADNITEPYQLSSPYASANSEGKLVFNQEGLSQFKVRKNNVEDVAILQVAIEEYQESENSQNYPNAQLLVTLADFEMDIDSRYSLIIPAGLVNISYDGKSVANEDVTYVFTLKAQEAFVLPDPVVTPAAGNVTELSEVSISWPGSMGGFDNLNKGTGTVTATYNNNPFTGFKVSYEWSSEAAMADGEGADGDMLVLTFDENLENGTYVVTIPGGFVNVSDIDKGTLENEPLVLTYNLNVQGSGVGSLTVEGALNIYNLNGVKVGESLNNLPAGVYIVNGKKVVVK